MRIAEIVRVGPDVDCQQLRLSLGALCISFLAQRFNGRNAQHVAFDLLVQCVVLQHQIECLVPRHVVEHQRERAAHVGIEHDVQTADLVNETEEIFQINVLQVHRNRLAGVAAARPRSRWLRVLLLLARQIHRRRAYRCAGRRRAHRLLHGRSCA